MLLVKPSEFLKKPGYYLGYFFKRFLPYRVTINGKSFRVKYRQFWKDAAAGRWEPETFRVFDRFLSPDRSMVDVGAWIGPTTLYGASLARRCYSLEPDPAAFRELRKNTALNRTLARKISLFPYCLNDKNKRVRLANREFGGDSTASMIAGNRKSLFRAEGVTFAKFRRQNKITDVNFIKMDIEGGETIVLPAMRKYLKKHKPTLYLSLHPQLIASPVRSFKPLIEIIKMYQHLYDNRGNPLTVKALQKNYLGKKIPLEIVVTDTDWEAAFSRSA